MISKLPLFVSKSWNVLRHPLVVPDGGDVVHGTRHLQVVLEELPIEREIMHFCGSNPRHDLPTFSFDEVDQVFCRNELVATKRPGCENPHLRELGGGRRTAQLAFPFVNYTSSRRSPFRRLCPASPVS